MVKLNPLDVLECRGAFSVLEVMTDEQPMGRQLCL